jgi:two-component system sensor histidine kinase KdpD
MTAFGLTAGGIDMRKKLFCFSLGHTLRNGLITILALALASLFAYTFQALDHGSLDTYLFYLLAIMAVALLTTDYICGGLAVLGSIGCMNLFFADPFFKQNFCQRGYPTTYVVMMTISFLISTIMTHLKESRDLVTRQADQLLEAEKEKMRANLLRAISHDLRTPLTGIIGASQTYLDNEVLLPAEEKRNLVCHILEDSRWLLDMVENLLSVTRIQGDLADLTTTLEPVEEVVGEAILRLKQRIPDASIQVCVPDEFLMIPMDAMLIEQVLINLLENAITHSNSKRPLQCIVNYDKTQVFFHIIDYGIGIPEERLKTIFDEIPFQPGKSVDSRRGMGIGLSICKTIILAHHGTITAHNHREGAEFLFTLPRGQEEPFPLENHPEEDTYESAKNNHLSD